MGQKEDEAEKCEEGQQVGLEVLAFREVVQCAVALGPGNDGDEERDEGQEHSAGKEKDARQPIFATWDHLRFSIAAVG